MSASHDCRVRPRPFTQVDVFGAGPFAGNPLAVVLDGEGLSEERMAAVASWTNLSETTVVLPPTDPAADYRVRILTPTGELPFAGHPTLGTAAAWLLAGGRPRTPGMVVQECAAGLVEVRIESGPHLRPDDGPVAPDDCLTGGAASPLRLAFRAPALTRDTEPDGAELEAALHVAGLDGEDVAAARWTDNGPGWLSLLLRDVETLRAVRPRPSADGSAVKVGLCALTDARTDAQTSAAGVPTAGAPGAGVPGAEAAGDMAGDCRASAAVALEVRALLADSGVREDPVTGSLNAGLACWLTGADAPDGGHRLTVPFEAGQGAAVGRDGRVRVSADEAGELWIGGDVTVGVHGQILA